MDRRVVVLALALAACGSQGAPVAQEQRPAMTTTPPDDEPPTVESRLDEYGGAARVRLGPHFARAGVGYPPAELTLIALKDVARVEVWARAAIDDGPWRFVRAYPVMAASGGRGPKLREGDGQVPEGLYTIDWLNPNSAYHLSMHVDYPNAFDREHAAADGRTQLGGAIMIHGSDVSIGCLAMGDPAIEELFTLVADTGLRVDATGAARVKVILAPTDLRVDPDAMPPPSAPTWAAGLYGVLVRELKAFPR